MATLGYTRCAGQCTGSVACAFSQLSAPLKRAPLARMPLAGLRAFFSMAEKAGEYAPAPGTCWFVVFCRCVDLDLNDDIGMRSPVSIADSAATLPVRIMRSPL